MAGELCRLVDKARRAWDRASALVPESDLLVAVRARDDVEDVVLALHNARRIADYLADLLAAGYITCEPNPGSEAYAETAARATGHPFPWRVDPGVATKLNHVRDATLHADDRLTVDGNPDAWAPVPGRDRLWIDGHTILYAELAEALYRLTWMAYAFATARDATPGSPSVPWNA